VYWATKGVRPEEGLGWKDVKAGSDQSYQIERGGASHRNIWRNFREGNHVGDGIKSKGESYQGSINVRGITK